MNVKFTVKKINGKCILEKEDGEKLTYSSKEKCDEYIREKYPVMWEAYSKMKRHPVFLAASRFSRLTAAEIELGEPEYKERMKYRKFDDRFRLARRSFDDAVKEIFFPELIPKHLTGRAVSGIYACYTSFVLYLTVFTEGERRNAAILMTARYDALMDLLELRNNGILEF